MATTGMAFQYDVRMILACDAAGAMGVWLRGGEFEGCLSALDTRALGPARAQSLHYFEDFTFRRHDGSQEEHSILWAELGVLASIFG